MMIMLCVGCQLAMLALLSQAGQAATGQAVLGGAPLWHPQALAGFVGVSGAYDLEGLAQHLHRRGLYKNLLDTIMSIDGQVRAQLQVISMPMLGLLSCAHGFTSAPHMSMLDWLSSVLCNIYAVSAPAGLQVAYDLLSPLHAARNPPPNIAAFLPPALLLHGTADKSVPVSSSLLLCDALQAAGAAARVHLLPGKTHTDLLLEDALGGGRDILTDSILEVITGQEHCSNYRSMCPQPLVKLAGMICPF